MAAKRPLSALVIPSLSTTTSASKPICIQCRSLHRLNAPTVRVPRPTPFVPDPQSFLTLIGRNMAQHAPKIPSWEALFSLSSEQLRQSGVEPPRARRYLLWWRERFRAGLFGPGGDATQVKDGIAELRIVEMPGKSKADQMATLTKDAGMKKVVVNVPPHYTIKSDPARPAAEGEETKDVIGIAPPPKVDAKSAKPIAGVRIVQGTGIGGTGVEPVKGHPGVAALRVKNGLWEQRRGHKVDGGERRKAEVRSKRRAQERKNAR
ncbi:hypothetical protein MBLNU230_g8119t1 [Neophaeotheca triangularis]